MYKLVIFSALLAVAFARPGNLAVVAAPAVHTYSAVHAAPALVAHSSVVTHHTAPVAAIAHAPVVAAPAVYAAGPAITYHGAPVSHITGYNVAHTVEPVEQHGYSIAY